MDVQQALISVPGSILHPPTHSGHVASLYASLLSIKRCLNLGTDESFPTANHGGPSTSSEGGSPMSIEASCKAWTLLAEIGLMIIGAGLGGPTAPAWAHQIEADVERAISKGLQLSHTSKIALRPFWFQLTLLHAHLALWQHNVRFSRSILKRLRENLTQADPPSTHYTILLSQHANLLAPVPSQSSSPKSAPPSSSSSKSSSQPGLISGPTTTEIQSALLVTRDLINLARSNGAGHENIVKLALVLRLRTLVQAELWYEGGRYAPQNGLDAERSAAVQSLLPWTETVLGLTFTADSSPAVPQPTPTGITPAAEPPEIINLKTHTLIIGVLYYTLVGEAKAASSRLSILHQLLDDPNDAEPNAEESSPSAYLTFPLPGQPPLIVKTTHPRVLFDLAFLVSSVSKRDLVGRKPKRKLFADEGYKITDSNGDELAFPIWASLGEVKDVEDRLAKIKADFLCEMIAIAITRSEFEEAEAHMATLIAHTRTYSIFPFYASRITLHQAHLAHATQHHQRALQCYAAAAHLDVAAGPTGGRSGGYVHVAARAGEAGLRLGLRALRRQQQRHSMQAPNPAFGSPMKGVKIEGPHNAQEEKADAELDAFVRQVAEECKRFHDNGTLTAIGKLLEAVMTPEIVKAKQRLRSALDITSHSFDNHLRALVIALTSSHYVHTASGHAEVMLKTAKQLAAGMGAPLVKDGNVEGISLGNAPLGLWVGERYHELHLRQGDAAKAYDQSRTNEMLRAAVRALPSRSQSLYAGAFNKSFTAMQMQ